MAGRVVKNRTKDAKIFKHTANKLNPKNTKTVMRGGIRS